MNAPSVSCARPSSPTYLQSATIVVSAPAEPSGAIAMRTTDPFAVFVTNAAVAVRTRPFAPIGKGSGAGHAGDPWSSTASFQCVTVPVDVTWNTTPDAESVTSRSPASPTAMPLGNVIAASVANGVVTVVALPPAGSL